jgi:hypothetical protein
MGRPAGGDPAQGPEVLLRWRQLPAEDLHRAATWHGAVLRAAQLPIERSSPLADACPGWPRRSATVTPPRASGVQIDSSALATQGSMQGFIASAAPPVPSSTLSAKQQNRQRRYSLYKEMKALADGGTSQSDIARQLDLSLRTVQRWTGAGVFPERTQRSYPHSVDTSECSHCNAVATPTLTVRSSHPVKMGTPTFNYPQVGLRS